DHRRDGARLDVRPLPALALLPALERGAHHHELAEEGSQVVGGAGELALLREQRLDLLRQARELAPAGSAREAARVGEAPAVEAAAQAAEVADDAAVEPEGEGDADDDAQGRDGREPRDERGQGEVLARTGEGPEHPP